MVQEDQIAPKFTAQDQAGKATKLADFLGKWVVLYFYPQDDTPGCTREAKDFSQHAEEFTKRNVVVLGVSTQGQESHASFAQKYGITVLLVADADTAIAKQYGVLQDSGKAQRVTFAIDPVGVVRKIWTSVQVDGHTQEVLEFLDSQNPHG